MPLKKETKELYFNVLDLRRQGRQPFQIARSLGISERAVHQALTWLARNGLSENEDIRIAIAIKELELARLNERLQEFRQGLEETVEKRFSNGRSETTTIRKFSPTSEVALLRLIQQTQDEIRRMKIHYRNTEADSRNTKGAADSGDPENEERTRLLRRMEESVDGS